MVVDQGLRLLGGLGVGHVGSGDSRLAACSAIGTLLRVTLFNCVTGSFAKSAHNRRGTWSTGVRWPSLVVAEIAIMATANLIAQICNLVL